MAPVTTRAVLLRAYDYGETSRILRFYTRDHGVLGIMAKGVKGRSAKGGSGLATFASGSLTAYVKPHRDLHTMKDFACDRPRSGLGSSMLRFYGASAVGELVMAHADQEAHPELLEALENALNGLETAPEDRVAAAALAGLWTVVEAFGFAPQLDPCVRCGRTLRSDEMGRFDHAAGGIRCSECAQDSSGPRMGPGARAQLSLLLAGDSAAALTHARRHLALLDDFVAFHVSGRPLKTLGALADILPDDGD